MNWAIIQDVGLSLGAASLVGALLALHPMRVMRTGVAGIDWDTVRAQILVTVAGALMVVVVGDSVARAFGLVGIGSFIRFRTVMKSARDTAVLLLLIALGMGCGLNLWAMTLAGTGFFFLLLFPIDMMRDRGGAKEKKEPPLPLSDEGLL